MELVSFDEETITIRMNRKREFGALSNIVSAAAIDPDKLDPEITMLTADEVSQIEDAFRAIDERVYGRT